MLSHSPRPTGRRSGREETDMASPTEPTFPESPGAFARLLLGNSLPGALSFPDSGAERALRREITRSFYHLRHCWMHNLQNDFSEELERLATQGLWPNLTGDRTAVLQALEAISALAGFKRD